MLKNKWSLIVFAILVCTVIWYKHTNTLSDITDIQERTKISSNLEGTSASASPLSDDSMLARQTFHKQRQIDVPDGKDRSVQKRLKILNNTPFFKPKAESLKLSKQDPTLDPLVRKDLESLALINASGAEPSLRFDPFNNILSITGEFYLQSQDGSEASKITAVTSLIDSHKSLTGFGANEVAVVTEDILKNDRGESIIRLNRRYRDLPVWGRQLVVTEKNGAVLSISGKFQAITDNIDISANLSDQELNKLVADKFEKQGLINVKINAVMRGIYLQGNIPIYAYQVITEASHGRKWELYFSPNSKSLIAEVPLFYEVSTPSSGIDLRGEERAFNSYYQNNEYVMRDQSFPQQSYTAVGEWSETSSSPYVKSNNSFAGWSPAGVSAVHNSKETHDYFYHTHGRNSFDGYGAPLISIVNKTENGEPYFNAYWNGSMMVYGTGADGSKNMAIALDVAGHEFSHGVVQFTSNLRYQNQSGALNESFSDFFGAMIDRDDWFIGEDLVNPYSQYDYLRDMSNPSSTGHPGHMDNFRHLPNTKEGDWGGVHINSGIQNRALYLLAEGLTVEGKGTSIGKDKTERLAYATLQKLSSDAEFVDSANTMILEAESLYGSSSTEYQSVVDAWNAVGVISSAVVSEGGSDAISLENGDDVLVHLYPRDGEIGNLFTEEYDVYVQLVNQPFAGYIGSAQIGPINDYPATHKQPTLHTNAQGNLFSIYVGTDNIARITYVSNISEDIEILNDVQSVAVSPDGEIFAFVPFNNNTIYLYSFIEEIWETITVTGASYSEDGRTTDIELVDAISFDSTGQKIIFDFMLCASLPEEPDCQEFWSIGIYDRGTEKLEYPFSSASTDVDIGFPAFSNTRNDVIAFDYIDWTSFDTDGKALSLALIYDLSQREIISLYTSNFSEYKASTFGIPSFVGEDDALVVQGQWDTSTTLLQYSIDNNYNFVENTLQYVLPFDGAFGKAHRNAYKNITASLESDKPNVDLGTKLVGTNTSTEFTLLNNGNREIAITEISITSDSMSTRLTNRVLLPEESVTFAVNIEATAASLGLLSGTLSIQHTGDNAMLNLGVSAFVDLDTDNDGIGNSADTDDDNDGVNDANDAFPLDPTEQLDTDSDGIGNNADTDDDGDGASDVSDIFPLDPTEQLDTDSDGIGNNADSDDDGDGVQDSNDAFPLDSLYTADSDNDGMADAWEIRYGLDPNDPTDAASDTDNDGAVALQEFIEGTIPAGSLDIDGNGQYDALTDGLLLLRGMFGLANDALINGAVASDAQYTSGEEIKERIDVLGDLVDIDGNGQVDALTDGLVILRYLFGLRGDVLINGVIASDASVTDATGISTKIEILMPTI